MPKLRNLSGKKCISILVTHFGFFVVRQKGSHIVLRNNDIGTVVPNHPSIKIGTLKSILKLAGVDLKEFIKHV